MFARVAGLLSRIWVLRIGGRLFWLEPGALLLFWACARSFGAAASRQARTSATPKTDFIPMSLKAASQCGSRSSSQIDASARA